MLGKTAKEIMNEFKNYIYLDTNRKEACIIENWITLTGRIDVRYASGKLESYNDVVQPNHMRIIGRQQGWLKDRDYIELDKEERKLFNKELTGLAKLALHNESLFKIR